MEGEVGMAEDEREVLKYKASRLITIYKKYMVEGIQKKAKIIAHRMFELADTEEKYEIINHLFFEITGEYVLDKMKKEQEKQEEKEKSNA